MTPAEGVTFTEADAGAKSDRGAGYRSLGHPRLDREWRTVAAMISVYCEGQHRGHGKLCPECRSLSAYAHTRLERCVFGGGKPTCAKCPVHCYQPARRVQMKDVMRYAGPRMLWKHPLLTVRHWLDGLFPPPEKP